MADDGSEAVGLASGRSRRQRKDRRGTSNAFDKFKELKEKGIKNKAEDEDMDNIYDVVDEKEYSKRVQKRLDEDWVVDDLGIGYADDGREIFDEELDDRDEEVEKNRRKKKVERDQKNKKMKGGGNIMNMLMNMPKKEKKNETAPAAKLEDDALLSEVLGDLDLPEPSSASSSFVSGEASGSGARFMSNVSPVTPIPTSLRRKPRTSSPFASTPLPDRAAHSPSTPDLTPLKGTSLKNPFATTPTARNTDLDIRPKPKRLKVAETSGSLRPGVAETRAPATVTCPSPPPIAEEESSDWLPDTEPLEPTFQPQATISVPEEIVDDADDDLLSQAVEIAETRVGKSFMSSATFPQPLVTDSQAPSSVDQLECMSVLEDGSKSLKLFWFDAHEDPVHQPGNIFLFGKIWSKEKSSYVSACCVVRDIERHIFLLPRVNHQKSGEPVLLKEVYDEFNAMTHRMFKSRDFTFRSVFKNMKYAFDIDEVPNEAEYVEVRYPARFGHLPHHLEGDTFSHVFGGQSSCLERLLLDVKMKGPSWLQIKNPKIGGAPISWCSFECSISGLSGLSVMQSPPAPPPLSLMSITVRTAVNMSSLAHEIVSVACVRNANFPLDKAPPKPAFDGQHWIVLSKPSDCAWPYDLKNYADLSAHVKSQVHRRNTENEVLALLLREINAFDPDIIMSHDLAGHDLEVILHRLQALKTPRWDKIGRLRRHGALKLPTSRLHAEQFVPGRLLCDLQTSAKELIKAKTYDLPSLCAVIMAGQNIQPPEHYPADKVKTSYMQSRDLLRMLQNTLEEAACVLQLACDLNVLPLALQITNIAGSLMSRTLLGGRSERNEWLLLHAFFEKGYIVPDKWSTARREGGKKGEQENEKDGAGDKKKKATYAGGLVLDPAPGLYESFILLLDFNSLYPSIIQEFNICFTTVARGKNSAGTSADPLLALPSSDAEPGILPNEIRKLVESRRAVKNLLKDPNISPDLKMQYDIRQKALKLTANSMYGCLGFAHSRFYAPILAALTTAKGRDTLLQAKDMVERSNFRVIYGDTDSLMVATNSTDYDQVLGMGKQIKTNVNRMYRLLELDIDGVFASMLLLKKKKYAALVVSRDPKTRKLKYEEELKGLDIVRRDWSVVACEAGRFVVTTLLEQGVSLDDKMDTIIDYMTELAGNLRSGKIPLSKLIITKSLTKDPESYSESTIKSLPHVLVALRSNKNIGAKRIRSGDTVEYIVCKDGTDNAATQRGYSMQEVNAKRDALSPDLDYYLTNQISPVVNRLLEPLIGIDPVRIAHALGVDPKIYLREEPKAKLDLDATDIEIAARCPKLTYTCRKCGAMKVLERPIIVPGEGKAPECSLARCAGTNCTDPPFRHHAQLKRDLIILIRNTILAPQEGMHCSKESCEYRVDGIPDMRSQEESPTCPICDSHLLNNCDNNIIYHSFLALESAFDIKKEMLSVQASVRSHLNNQLLGSMSDVYDDLLKTVKAYDSVCEFSRFNCYEIFHDQIPVQEIYALQDALSEELQSRNPATESELDFPSSDIYNEHRLDSGYASEPEDE